jgi:hypothetical protein
LIAPGGKPFLTEHADNIRLRYYKGGIAKRILPILVFLPAQYAPLLRPAGLLAASFVAK